MSHTDSDFLDEEGRWRCNRCGSCCRAAGLVYPELDRGDGVCRHLTDENECAIYEDRPDVCRATTGTDAQRAAACRWLAERYYEPPESVV